MAVVRLGYLRMVSLSPTALDRTANVLHVVRDLTDGRRTHSNGINVQAQCGTRFTGAIPGNQFERPWAVGLPVHWSNQPIRPCSKCQPKGMLFIGLEQPWTLGPAGAELI